MHLDPSHPLPLEPHFSRVRRRPRVAFYSHDTMGLGHLRRNLLIATALTGGPLQAESLIIAGSREAGYFSYQAGMDCVTLPALYKCDKGGYASRNYGWSLEKTTRLRSQVIAAAVESFQPDFFIVDKVPRGIGNELVPVLEKIRNQQSKEGARTRCILGLRDVLDDPQVVAREWAREASNEAVERYFDEIWIYGDRKVFDSIAEYCFSNSVASRAQFTGYLDQSIRLLAGSTDPQMIVPESSSSDAPLALCVVGGGQDGFELAAAFVAGGVPLGWKGIVITGPYMPSEQRRQLAVLNGYESQISIIDQLVETDHYLASACRVVSMGGYNSVMSILSYCKPALVVPRISPRREQSIRAERLENSGWLTVQSPESLTPVAIRNWLEAENVPTPLPGCVNLGGLNRINDRVRHLLSGRLATSF